MTSLATVQERQDVVSAMTLGFEECYEILRVHGKTFYVMAKLLGADRGNAIAAVYGFARTSDDTVDVADEGADHASIVKNLDLMQAELRAALANRSKQPRYMVLAETIKRYGIETYPFDDLIAGVSMDLTKVRYENFDELSLYCYRVAGTIGLMITPIAGYQKNSRALEYAKTLGGAFQLTNILRDVGDDLKRGRIYLPQDEMKNFGITDSDLIAGRLDDNFKALMEFQINRAFDLYKEGLALIPLVTSFKGQIAFRFAVDAYSEIMNKIRLNDYDVYSKRAHLTLFEKLWMIPKSIWRVYRQRKNHIKNVNRGVQSS